MFTGNQLKAALALAGKSRADLVAASSLSPRTVQRLCDAEGLPSTSAENMLKVEAAVKSWGVRFIDKGVLCDG